METLELWPQEFCQLHLLGGTKPAVAPKPALQISGEYTTGSAAPCAAPEGLLLLPEEWPARSRARREHVSGKATAWLTI